MAAHGGSDGSPRRGPGRREAPLPPPKRQKPRKTAAFVLTRNWSGRRDSNPRPQPWQGCALPLSYTRSRGSSPQVTAIWPNCSAIATGKNGSPSGCRRIFRWAPMPARRSVPAAATECRPVAYWTSGQDGAGWRLSCTGSPRGVGEAAVERRRHPETSCAVSPAGGGEARIPDTRRLAPLDAAFRDDEGGGRRDRRVRGPGFALVAVAVHLRGAPFTFVILGRSRPKAVAQTRGSMPRPMSKGGTTTKGGGVPEASARARVPARRGMDPGYARSRSARRRVPG